MAGAASIKDYIGSKVSLISASDVRYEGCLYTIDPEESTVALQRVRCMGTEYRRTGDQAIPPSDTTYEFIIFRGEHIKSLHVAEDQRSPTRNENPDMLNLLKFSPNKGDKRSGNRSNGVQDAYPQDDRSPPKRFVGIAPQRPPPRQYDDFNRGPVHYDQRRQRRSPPQYQQHYNQPHHQDHQGYQRYPPYGPPADRGYPPQGGYRGYNRGGGGRRPDQQWGYYPQQQQNYGGNWGRRQRRPRNQRRDNSYHRDGGYRNDYRDGGYRDQYHRDGGYRGQRGYQNQDHRQKDKRDVVPGQGGFLSKVGQTKGDIQIPDADFDILQANAGFDKAKLKEEYAKRVEESSKTGEPAVDEKTTEPTEESTHSGQTEESPKRKYEMPEAAYKSKGGFFDSLSTDRDQKVDKEALKQQRRVDEDTFGEIAKNYMSRHNRRRGGGGGGGARRWGGAQRGRQRPRRSRTWFPRK